MTSIEELEERIEELERQMTHVQKGVITLGKSVIKFIDSMTTSEREVDK